MCININICYISNKLLIDITCDTSQIDMLNIFIKFQIKYL